MLSTKIIDLVYEIVNIINNSKTNPYRCFCNDGNFYVAVTTIGLRVFNNVNDEIFYVDYNRTKKMSVYLSTKKHTLVDLRLVRDVECRSSYKHYDVKDLINLSTEERFYHELNSPKVLTDLIEYNDYIMKMGYDTQKILSIRFHTNVLLEVLHEVLKLFLEKLES